MANSQLTLDLKCLVSGGPDGSKAYALVKTRDVYVLVQALLPADAPHLLRWEYVTAGWSFRESYNLNGDTPSCIMNKAGELIAMGSWGDSRLSTNKTRRGLVYNPHNPLPLVERRWTSNALWMAVDVATDINNHESERAQLMIDTGADDGSALEVALTGSQLLIRRLHSTGFSTRELVGLGGWTLPRPLDSESTARLQYSDKFLYIFTTYGTYGADDTSLVRIPFNPNSTFSGQILAGPPTGTTPIDISSALNKCNWREGFSTAASDNKFYLFCNRLYGLNTMSLYVYDNTAADTKPKLGAAVLVTGIDPWSEIDLFQPLKNTTFAMVTYTNYSENRHNLLSLSGSNVGTATRLPIATITVGYDTLFNNILPDQGQIPAPKVDGIPSEEIIIGSAFGVLAALAGLVFLTLRYRRRQSFKQNHQKDAETIPGSYGLEPLATSASTNHSGHASSAVGPIAGTARSREANTHLSPTVYAAPQSSVPPSPAMSAGLPVSSWPTSPPTAANAAPLSSATLSPAPSEGSPSVTSSGTPPADTFQMELQQLGFSSHPRPNFVTTAND